MQGYSVTLPHKEAAALLADHKDTAVELTQAANTLVREKEGFVAYNTDYQAAVESLKAIDAHDVTSLMNSGETLDTACESCHRNYWYRTPPPEGAGGSERK